MSKKRKRPRTVNAKGVCGDNEIPAKVQSVEVQEGGFERTSDKIRTVLFSGRMDELHPGHIATIFRLLLTFDLVTVVILDYLERSTPARYIKQILGEIVDLVGKTEKIIVLINKTHFGEITIDEWKKYGCETYAGGNMKVLRHMDKLGIPIYYTDRAFDYSASNYKRDDLGEPAKLYETMLDVRKK